MAGFVYTAVDRQGREKRGKVDAPDRDRAIELIKGDNLLPVTVQEEGLLNKDLDFSIGKKVKPRDMSVFCRQFVSIMQAGVPMKEALQMLGQQTENKLLEKAITEVLASIEKGNTLADAMRGQPKVFSDMLINMVDAGESSGNLEMAFDRMAVQYEKEAKLKATVRKATIYPIMLICAAFGVLAVMIFYVIPIFIDMFNDLDVEMPGITMMVMNVSEWSIGHWYVYLIVIGGCIFGYQAIYNTTEGRSVIDDLKLRIPLFGKLVTKTACARFARTTCTLLSAGIPMMQCLETVSRIVGNVHFEKAMMDAREQVMKGIPLSEPLEACGLFPPMVCHMTGIGEETGNMEEMLEKLADYYDEEVELTTQSLLAAMEPIIIVFMAVFVGILVIAVVSPIGTMYQGLDNL